jgi:hypothetical protein
VNECKPLAAGGDYGEGDASDASTFVDVEAAQSRARRKAGLDTASSKFRSGMS